ncbi:ribonuclease H-like protein [Xylariaceae sp. FL1651]|nr:ribonuclease H-like protein [Xylariaceae sp. FL1651]
MPLGGYLAQGSIPLDPSSSDDEQDPCELPDGRLVCSPHGLVVCGMCCVDYSFMEDVLSGSDDEECPWELPDGRLVCKPHGLVVCEMCSVDYSFMEDEDFRDNDGVLDEETESAYLNLSPEIRAVFNSRFGIPLSRGSRARMSTPSAQVASSTVAARSTREASSSASPTLQLGETDPEMPEPLLSSFGTEKRRGTGRVFPTRFTPPSTTIKPTELFPGKATYANLTRYIHCHDPRKILIFTDGACLNNGQPNPKAGWAIVDGPGFAGQPHFASSRLENVGPFGDRSFQSSNRAELRAVIAALRLRHWVGEGFKDIVIATDSEYVTTGSTTWAKTWVQNNWKTSSKTDVKNKDLWEMLLGEVERWHDAGLSIQFWRIPRDWNKVSDAAAKKAAEGVEVYNQWMDVMGICF